MDEYRILALDGGGVRGAFTSRLIERLQKATGFLDQVDLIAGTSTGGIIALALAAGKPRDGINEVEPGKWVVHSPGLEESVLSRAEE